jgi:hypothetical protein
MVVPNSFLCLKNLKDLYLEGTSNKTSAFVCESINNTLNIASQKNSINVYHMAIYANGDLYSWFVNEYPKHSNAKLDMGKSCIRFKKMDAIPYALIGELMSKINPQQWIEMYENAFVKK